MTKPKFFTKNFIENGLHFGIYFLVLTVVPLIGMLFAPLWDWVCYGMLYDLFTDIHTAFLWLGLEILFVQLEKRRRRSLLKEREPKVVLVASGDEFDVSAVEELAYKKAQKPLLPMKNVGILTGICVACIFMFSAIVNFQVKPFFDIAQNGSGYAFWCSFGNICLNVFKCMWITAMLGSAKNMAAEIVKTCFPQKKEWFVWLLTGCIFVLFGILDAFVLIPNYPLNGQKVLLCFAYLVCYCVFPMILYFTKESRVKTYFLILLIYIF